MYLARVRGNAVSSAKEPNLTGLKLLVVQDVSDRGTDKTILAADSVGAGVGELVLVLQEGGSARQALDSPEAPVNDVIIGIVDSVACVDASFLEALS